MSWLSRGIFVARNYDRLVDAPIELGTFHETSFDVNGATIRIAVDADPVDYDIKSLAEMVRKVVAAEMEWMDDKPFGQYLFIYHFPRGLGAGGMEHAYSTAIEANADRIKEDPAGLASTTAHEFFHLWNVKRIRPATLEPIDYVHENYTRALWFSEGVTSTVADYALLRAGIWIIEGLDLSQVEHGTYELICLPLRIADSDGAPARAILRKADEDDGA